jgi:uncharacterized protein
MRHAKLGDAKASAFVLIFEPGDEVVSGITMFARDEHIGAARLEGIGALEGVTLGYLDRATKTYVPVEIEEQVELLSLVGNIALKDGVPLLHAHATVGYRGGGVSGGHLIRGVVWPTLELFIEVYPEPLSRRQRPELGIATIDLAARSN